MKTKIVLVLLGVLLVLPASVDCRNTPLHNELWARIYVVHKFTPKLRVEGEYQYRWQNTPNGSAFPTWKLAQGGRIWAFYQIKPQWTIGLSPFAMFRTYPLLNSEADFHKAYTDEIRFATGVEWKKPIGKMEIKSRVNYESRSFNKQGQSEWTRKDRVRGRLLISRPLFTCDSGGEVSGFAGDEYFYQGEAGFTKENAFDQNRIMCGLSWKMNHSCKLDMSYMYILKNASTGKYIENVILINTTFYL